MTNVKEVPTADLRTAIEVTVQDIISELIRDSVAISVELFHGALLDDSDDLTLGEGLEELVARGENLITLAITK